jgi:histidinol-phosphate/aromatic aminotransferase/cobyric acid decarboxylase-like protein
MAHTANSKAYHGGAFFEFIGPKFDHLSKVNDCINADVLDAWFDPSPRVIAKTQEYLPWLLRTSPPTHCEGMIEVVANWVGVRPHHLLPGAGSSSLIFLAMQKFLTNGSRTLILDPTYGEYRHVFEQVIGCKVAAVPLARNDDRYLLDLAALVNPNSPTGTVISRQNLLELHRRIPKSTLLWVDETYIDYVDKAQSIQKEAADSDNIIVCKSLSKIYSLSGARSAYLCSSEEIIEQLNGVSPPWAVSLPAQLATIFAIQDPDYYEQRYRETAVYREHLTKRLSLLGFKTYQSVANFLLIEMPPYCGAAKEFVIACRKDGLYLRDVSSMGRNLTSRMIRVAVKSAATNERMLGIMEKNLKQFGQLGERN